MMRIFAVAFLVAVALSGSCSALSYGVHYSIVASKAFRPSSAYNISATCYNVDSDVNLTLRLRSSDNYVQVTARAVILTANVTQIVSLMVPDKVPETYYILEAIGTGGFNFSDSRSVSVKRKTLSLFIQTDKAIYKPGQTVLLRTISLYPDLKPYKGSVDIVIYDPLSNKIMQWLKQMNDTGVLAERLKLSEETALGIWRIVSTAGTNSVTRTFEVAEYVLPKFDVSVTLPPFYLLNVNRKDQQQDLRVSVISKYTYGQPVKGRANVTIQLKPYSDWDDLNYTKILRDVQLVNGKADIVLTIDDLLTLPFYNYYPDKWTGLADRIILVTARVNETVTGIVLSKNATVTCKTRRYQLEFPTFSPLNFKPGLLYTDVLHLSKVDGSTPDSADILSSDGNYSTITIQATMRYSPNDVYPYMYIPPTVTYLTEKVTESGYVTFSLTIDSNVSIVDLQPSFYDNLTQTTISAYKTIDAFKSKENQAMQIAFNSQDGVIKAPQEATFNVTTTNPITTFHYEVMSKGNILMSESVAGVDASTEHTFSIWISKELAMKLTPSARFLVWYTTDTGEIITDSTQVSVGDVFANTVSLSFDRETTTPSQNVSLNVTAYQGSYVCLLAVDQSVLLIKGSNDVTQDMVSEDLTYYDSVSDENYPRDRKRRRKRSLWLPYYIDGSDAETIVDNAGLLFMTDGYFYSNVFTYPPYPMFTSPGIPGTGRATTLMVGTQPATSIVPTTTSSPGTPGGSDEPDNAQPRVDFPETWIWMDATTSSNGQVTLEMSVPDTITSWVASAFAVSDVAGFGVAANTAKLTVFKQFFLSPNLPYSVIRGEEFALQVTVFNYMSTRLNAMVSLQPSDYYKVQGITSKNVQVESNDAASVYFWIVPGALGQIPIDIKAQASVAGDAVSVMLLVKPEGVEQRYSTSNFIQLSSDALSYNNTLEVSLPPTGQLVPGSEYLEVTVIGDLMGPSIKGLDNLLQMPYGCGEQNMLFFAPDVYIVQYLNTSGQLTQDIKDKALGFMLAGYQRELLFQRSDGSFSAFGNSDLSGSVWLSSFVIKCFHQAKDYIAVDDAKIAQTMYWIIANQALNGSFAEPRNGRVIHVDMQGGSSQGLSMTAYVLISLLENENNTEFHSAYLNDSIDAARTYLEEQVSSAASDPYALSIIAYALVRAQSSKVSDVLQMVESLAKVTAGTKHWEKTDNSSNGSPFGWTPPYLQARAINIEMTSYVLLTYCQLKNLSMSLPIAKWIVAQRNANGGFASTQDTVMALEALTAFATMIYGVSGQRNFQVSISTETIQHSYLPVTDETSILLQSYELPSNTTKVFVSATGRGSALVQLNVKYNVFKTDDASPINLKVNTTQNGKKITIKSCSSWTNEKDSGMVVWEIYQLTGYKTSNVDDIKNQANDVIKRVENDDEKVVIYFDGLTSNEICVDVTSEKVFPANNLKDAPVKVYPYYDPSGSRTLFYAAPQTLGQNSACSECPECCVANGRATPVATSRNVQYKTLPFTMVANRTTPAPKKPAPK